MGFISHEFIRGQQLFFHPDLDDNICGDADRIIN